ncbi:MAG: nitroreductase family protein [Actinomycetota bacterium]
MEQLGLTNDELLTTTRAVRKRLDFEREVPLDVIRDCVRIAMQSPSGSNNMTMRFVVVLDADKRAAIGDVYRRCWEMYEHSPMFAGAITKSTSSEQAQQERVVDSATYLGHHLGEAPALVIACTESGRVDGKPAMSTASMMGNCLPAMWSFMLAARARGLGTAWTTIHLMMEQEVADILGIPFESVQQACLSPVAYTKGTDFKPAMRPEPDTIMHVDAWGS